MMRLLALAALAAAVAGCASVDPSTGATNVDKAYLCKFSPELRGWAYDHDMGDPDGARCVDYAEKMERCLNAAGVKTMTWNTCPRGKGHRVVLYRSKGVLFQVDAGGSKPVTWAQIGGYPQRYPCGQKITLSADHINQLDRGF